MSAPESSGVTTVEGTADLIVSYKISVSVTIILLRTPCGFTQLSCFYRSYSSKKPVRTKQLTRISSLCSVPFHSPRLLNKIAQQSFTQHVGPIFLSIFLRVQKFSLHFAPARHIFSLKMAQLSPPFLKWQVS